MATPGETLSPPAESTANQPKSAFVRAFNRIFSRHLMSCAMLVLVLFLMAGNIRAPGNILHDPDLWWHIADARILATTHHFIRVEPYSFSVAGKHWVDPEWLSEEPFWLGYSLFGYSGIYLATLLILCANILFVYWRSAWRSGHAGAAFWASAIGISLMIVNAGPRTIAVAYLAMSAEMAILEAASRGRTRLLWLLPPLFLVWINLHGSWLIGLGLLGLYILSGFFAAHKGVFEQEAFTPEVRNRLLLVFALCVAVLIVNPYGWRLIWNPIDMMVNQKLNIQNVQEWQPLNLAWFVGKGALAMILLTVIANALHGRKWKVYDFVLVLFAWYAAFAHARFAFMAAVLTVPILAIDFENAFISESDEKTIPVINMVMVLAAIGAVVYFYPSKAKMEEEFHRVFPLETIASIQPSWRTFNNDGLGGIMDWEHRSTFIDSRDDTFEHHGVLKDYLDMIRMNNTFELMDKYHIDHALISSTDALAYLFSHAPGWTLVRSEGPAGGSFLLYARTPGSPAGASLVPPNAKN